MLRKVLGSIQKTESTQALNTGKVSLYFLYFYKLAEGSSTTSIVKLNPRTETQSIAIFGRLVKGQLLAWSACRKMYEYCGWLDLGKQSEETAIYQLAK